MRRLILLVLALPVLLWSCGGGDGTTPPVVTVSIAIAGGDGQTATAGEAVATSPSVRLTNSEGENVSGTTVTFEVTDGGGTVTGGTQTTDANGIATVGSWTLGTTAGTNTLRATAAGSGINGNPVTFTATGEAGPHAQVTASDGDGGESAAGLPVSDPPAILAEDVNGNPVSGVEVTFAVTAGGGTVTGASQTTGTDGVATVGSWTLGTEPGENEVTATVADALFAAGPDGAAMVFTVTFTVTAVAGPPGIISASAGEDQSAPVNMPVAVPPEVTVTDAFENPVEGAEVTFAVASGGGTVTGATQSTDEEGKAAVGSWTLGSEPGENTLTATVEGDGVTGNPVTFTATATPLTIAKVAGDDQVAGVSTAVAVAPQIQITDADDNPVEGVDVTFAVASGGGTATGLEQTTDNNGMASVGSWTLGPAAGENTLTATADGTGIVDNPVTFTATGTVATPAKIAVNAGDGQTAIAGNAVAVPPSVLVTDDSDDPVEGVPVDFVVTSGGGATTVTSPTGGFPAQVQVMTDASGIATVGGWTLGSDPGENTMTATAAGDGIDGNPVTFTATGSYDPEEFDGNWAGDWENTTFSSTGSVTASLTVTPNAVSPASSQGEGGVVALTVDFNGFVFGISNPDPENYTATYGPEGFTLTEENSDTFNEISVTVTPDGMITGSALNPTAGITRVDIEGTISPTEFSVNYTVIFGAGGQAVGTWTMTRQ